VLVLLYIIVFYVVVVYLTTLSEMEVCSTAKQYGDQWRKNLEVKESDRGLCWRNTFDFPEELRKTIKTAE
jgi:hypothetical protein